MTTLVSKWSSKLIDDARVIIYDRHMFIVQATDLIKLFSDVIYKLDNQKVPRHPSFLLKINTLSFSFSLSLTPSFSLSLSLSRSLSLPLSLAPFISLPLSRSLYLSSSLPLNLSLSFSLWPVRGCTHPWKHKARLHSKHSSREYESILFPGSSFSPSLSLSLSVSLSLPLSQA